jgi:hypothetical protein
MLLARNIIYHFFDYSCFASLEEVGLEPICDFEPDEELNDREPSNTSESAFEQIRSIDGLVQSRRDNGLSTIVEDENECSLGTIHLDFNSPHNG